MSKRHVLGTTTASILRRLSTRRHTPGTPDPAQPPVQLDVVGWAGPPAGTHLGGSARIHPDGPPSGGGRLPEPPAKGL